MADGVVLRVNADPETGLPEYAAQHERFFAAMAMVADNASGIAVREGRRLGGGLEASISGDGLGVVVEPGLAVVKHALTNGGDYVVALPVQTTKELPAKPGVGLKRRDTVALDVQDEDTAEKPSLLREANLTIIEGTNTSGTPTAPAPGLMQMTVAVVHFDGTNTPIIQPTNPRYSWAAGGIGVVWSQSERDGLSAYDGMKVYRADLDRWQQRRAGVWEDEGAADEDTDWVDYALVGGSGFSDNGTRVRKIGNRVRLEISVSRNGGSIAAGSADNIHFLTLEPGHRPGVNPEEAGDVLPAVGENGTSGGIASFQIHPSTGQVDFAYTNRVINPGDRLRAVVEYFTD